MSIWFIKALPDDRRVKVAINRAGEVVISSGGSMNVCWKLRQHFEAVEVVLPGLPPSGQPSLLINEISNPETHGQALQQCAALIDRLNCPVINHPGAVLGTMRDQMSRCLDGIPGLIVPKTIQVQPTQPDDVLRAIEEHELGETILMREVGQHGGQTLLKMALPDEQALLHQFAYDGRSFYLTRFVDYANNDGLYRKVRMACIGDIIRPRHMLISDHWMVHANARGYMDEHPEANAEEAEFLDSFDGQVKPKISATFAAITRAVPLEYFGVDCHIFPDGRVLLFEANANMNLLINNRKDKAAAQPVIDRIVDDLRLLVASRLEEKST